MTVIASTDWGAWGSLVAVVNWAFTEHLFIANVISAGLLLVLGDAVVQWLDISWRGWQEWRFDFIRNKRVLSVGFILGVFNHLWYAFLDENLSGSDLMTVLKKIFLDQLIAGPFFSSAFIIGMCILEGKGARNTFNEWKRMFPDIYKADWMFWPTAQFINFYLLPHKFRVFYVNIATLIWNTFLTYVKHKTNTPPVVQRRASTQCGGPAEASQSGSKRKRAFKGSSSRSKYFFMPRSMVARNFVRKQCKKKTIPIKGKESSGSWSCSDTSKASSPSQFDLRQTFKRSSPAQSQVKRTSNTSSFATPPTSDKSKSPSLQGSPGMRHLTPVKCGGSPVFHSGSPVMSCRSPVLSDRSPVLRNRLPVSRGGSPVLGEGRLVPPGSSRLTSPECSHQNLQSFSTSASCIMKTKGGAPIVSEEVNDLKSEINQVRNIVVKYLNQMNKQNVQMNRMSNKIDQIWARVQNSLPEVKNSSSPSETVLNRPPTPQRPLSRPSVRQFTSGKTTNWKHFRKTHSVHQLDKPNRGNQTGKSSLHLASSRQTLSRAASRQSIFQSSFCLDPSDNLMPSCDTTLCQKGEKKKRKRRKQGQKEELSIGKTLSENDV